MTKGPNSDRRDAEDPAAKETRDAEALLDAIETAMPPMMARMITEIGSKRRDPGA